MTTRTPSAEPPADPASGLPSGPPALRVRSTEDVIALVPLVLGFHPSDSVVVLTFGAPTGSFHARVDLPRSPDGVAEVGAVLARAVAANGATTAMVVVCSDEHEVALAAVEELVPALCRAGADVVDAVRIDGRCWWGLLGDGGWDAPPQPYDVSAHPFTAQFVLAGEVVREDRQAVADLLVTTDPAGTTRLGDMVEVVRSEHRDPCVEAAWLRGWLADRCRRSPELPTQPLTDEDAARALVLVQDDEQREVACLDLTREVARSACETWTELVRRAPDALVSGPAALLALSAWLVGDGALAWCAVDRSRAAAQPDVPLVAGVARALQSAVPPAHWTPPDPGRCRLLRDDVVAG